MNDADHKNRSDTLMYFKEQEQSFNMLQSVGVISLIGRVADCFWKALQIGGIIFMIGLVVDCFGVYLPVFH